MVFKKKERESCMQIKKNIYGLKQTARAWNEKLTMLQSQNFQQGKAEPCLFTRLKDGHYQNVLTYVDDLISCCQSKEDAQEIADNLNKEVEVKQLGDVNHYPGIQTERIENGSFLWNQRHKIMDLAESLGMKDAKKVSTPLEPAYLNLKDGREQSAIQRDNWQTSLSTVSRPDIFVSVGILCRKTDSPSHYDWNSVKSLDRYIIKTADLELKISACDNLRLVEYMNSDWGENKTDYKSISGHLFFCGESLISWTSQK
ncbi:PREDICTED: uncharacterized mitochondrial protein AtMg00810-like [Gekko japonicus]|uniref:Uncharacterized mitochondrial protein AtMg00810-like n=1 Tax=Gekko japonicus TaxID=146911 RepID=A0ABM1JN98_GEKJA|nr:PREDICTED: uncharacterized mitochondrial protein AtMg00810-like [Gekko japonicus]